jgi:hypothetical protein
VCAHTLESAPHPHANSICPEERVEESAVDLDNVCGCSSAGVALVGGRPHKVTWVGPARARACIAGGQFARDVAGCMAACLSVNITSWACACVFEVSHIKIFKARLFAYLRLVARRDLCTHGA